MLLASSHAAGIAKSLCTRLLGTGLLALCVQASDSKTSVISSPPSRRLVCCSLDERPDVVNTALKLRCNAQQTFTEFDQRDGAWPPFQILREAFQGINNVVESVLILRSLRVMRYKLFENPSLH